MKQTISIAIVALTLITSDVFAQSKDKEEYEKMPGQALAAQNNKDYTTALSIASEYMHRYLDHLSEKQFLLPENQKFLEAYVKMITSQDRAFKLWFKHPTLADSARHIPGFSENLVNNIISREEITNRLDESKRNGTEPDWDQIAEIILNKYGEIYVDNNVAYWKINWYYDSKDGKNYAKYLCQRELVVFKKMGIKGYTYNEANWSIFQYSTDTNELKVALDLQKKLVDENKKNGKPYGAELDTQANLLYKLGRKQEAIELEEQAVALAPDDKEIADALRKMEDDQRTWPLKNWE